MASTLESQNDSRLDELYGKVSALKNITIDIHGSASDHSLIDRSYETIGSFRDSVKASAGRVNRMMNNTGRPGTIKLAVVVLAVFFLVYFIWPW
jgi:hypothetical protein